MRVLLIAHTVINPTHMAQAGWVEPQEQHAFKLENADLLAEFAGRLCYRSWNRPNPATRRNEDYLAHIIEQQHLSVMEHASFTFYVDGVSRSLSHELVRHRHLSFSQVSQRYVDESDVKPILPPAVPAYDPSVGGNTNEAIIQAVMTDARRAYATLVEHLTATGLTRKEARQAARSVLPNATATAFVVTGNARAWREVIAKRAHPAADAEMQLLARELLDQLTGLAPHCFQDLAKTPRVGADSRILLARERDNE